MVREVLFPNERAERDFILYPSLPGFAVSDVGLRRREADARSVTFPLPAEVELDRLGTNNAHARPSAPSSYPRMLIRILLSGARLYTPSGHTPRSILVRIATAVYPEISAKRSIVTLSIMSVVLGLSHSQHRPSTRGIAR